MAIMELAKIRYMGSVLSGKSWVFFGNTWTFVRVIQFSCSEFIKSRLALYLRYHHRKNTPTKRKITVVPMM